MELPLLLDLRRGLASHLDTLLMIQVSNLGARCLLVHCIVEVIAALLVQLFGSVGPSNPHLVGQQTDFASEAPAY